MKKTLRFLSCLLIVAMLMTMMTVPAFADEPTDGSITLQGSSSEALTGKTFEIYRIFNATISAGQSGSTANVAYQWIEDDNGDKLFYDFFYGGTTPEITGSEAKNYTIDEVVAYINKKDKEAPSAYMMGLGKRLYDYAKTNGISAFETQVVTGDTKSVTFDDLPYGYYLIYEATDVTGEENAQVRSAVLLTTIQPNVEATLKNVNPTITKKARRLNSTLDGLSASVGEDLHFIIEAFIPDFSYYGNEFLFQIIDTPDPGISLKKDAGAYAVKIGSNTNPVAAGNDTYLVETVTDAEENITKVIFTFDEAFIKKYPDRILTIEYLGVLNKNVKVGGHTDTIDFADVNTVEMKYSSDPYGGISGPTNVISDQARVYSFYVDVTKKAAIGDSVLTGAEFTLHRKVDGVNLYATAKTVEEDGVTKLYVNPETGAYELTGWAKLEDGQTPQKFISKANGHLKIAGLGKGTFYLTETKAPAGYNLPVNPEVGFAIDGSCTSGDGYLETLSVTTSVPSSASVTEGTIYMTVTNAAGEVLPTTGGMGTTLFTIGGLILMAGAAALLIARRKAEN